MADEDWKGDKIPEIWQGHNVADFIDPEIMEVCRKGWLLNVLNGPGPVVERKITKTNTWLNSMKSSTLFICQKEK